MGRRFEALFVCVPLLQGDVVCFGVFVLEDGLAQRRCGLWAAGLRAGAGMRLVKVAAGWPVAAEIGNCYNANNPFHKVSGEIFG